MGKFTAYPRSSSGSAPRPVKILMVCADCVLIALAPILVQLSKNADGHFSYNPVSVNMLVELTKTLWALIILIALGTGQPGKAMYRSPAAFIRDARHCRLLMVPASLYAVNNYLKFIMQLFFKPTSAKMLGNLKVLTIALLLRAVMKRSFSVIQWEALFLLVAGISVNQLAGCSGPIDPSTYSIPALAATLGTVTVPSAASVYNEYALKRDMDTSVHLQNFFLYFYGLLFNAAAILIYFAAKGLQISTFFAGFNKWTLMLVVLNAAQGILSSFFFKFADTILKKYSSTLATILTGLMAAVVFGHSLTLNFAIGISIVFVSMHQFFSEGDKGAGPSQMKFTASPSMDHLMDHSRKVEDLMGRPPLPRSGVDLSGYDSSGSGIIRLAGNSSRKPLLPR